LGDYSGKLAYSQKDSQALADRIKYIYELSPEERGEIAQYFRNLIVKEHGLDALIKKIVGYLK